MLRATAFAIFATIAFTSATAPAGSALIGGCGLTASIQDPELRASFARFDAAQSPTAARICAISHNTAIAFVAQ